MAVQDYFDTDMGEQTIDVSASTHKFQTFLEKVNNEPSTLPPRRRSQTVRPRRQGAY